MNTIKQSITDLTNRFINYNKELLSSGKLKEEIRQLSEQFVTSNLSSELITIQNECESIGHSVETIVKNDGLLLSGNNNIIQFCVNCRKILG